MVGRTALLFVSFAHTSAFATCSKDGSQCPKLVEEQDQWLSQVLEEGKGARHRIVFSHIPPFIDAPEEDSGYFPLDRTTRLNLLSRLSKAKVSHWFCGHYHRNAGGLYIGEDGHKLEVVTTGAVGANITTDPDGKFRFVGASV